MFQRIKAVGSRISKALRSPKGFIVALRYAIHRGHPGAWASDHRAESTNITGWNYVAIKAKAVNAMQASVHVYQDGNDPAAKQKRTTLRKSFGTMAAYKSFCKSLYGKDDDTAKELLADSPLVRLLKRPNARQSGACFRFECVQQLESTGSVLIWNVPNKYGLTVERHVIPTSMATPMSPMTGLPHGGWRIDPGASRYSFPVVEGPDGFVESIGYFRAVGATIPEHPRDMNGELIRDQQGNPIGYIQKIDWPHPIYKDDGYSPLAAIALWSDLAQEVDRARWAHMKNQASPSLVISPGPEVSPTPEELEAAAQKFGDKYGGPENAGKAMFLSGDSKVEQLGDSARDMDYENGFTQGRDAVLAGHGVTPIAAGMTDGGSYAAFYAALKQFSQLTMQPILELLSEEDTERLAPQFGEGLTVEYEAAAIDDPDLLEKRLQTDYSAGNVLTVKEARALRGLPPLGDERDDEMAGAKAAPEPMGEHGGFGQQSAPGRASTGVGNGMSRPSKRFDLRRNGHANANGRMTV